MPETITLTGDALNLFNVFSPAVDTIWILLGPLRLYFLCRQVLLWWKRALQGRKTQAILL